MVGVCVALHPGFVLKRNEGGLSNYGLHIKTAVPYAFGLIGAAIGAERATRRAWTTDRWLTALGRLYASLLAVVLVTSFIYSLNSDLRLTHDTIGAIFAVVTTLSTIPLARRARGRGRAALAVVSWCGLILGALTFAGVLTILFVSQVLMGAAFGVLFVRAVRASSPPSPRLQP